MFICNLIAQADSASAVGADGYWVLVLAYMAIPGMLGGILAIVQILASRMGLDENERRTLADQHDGDSRGDDNPSSSITQGEADALSPDSSDQEVRGQSLPSWQELLAWLIIGSLAGAGGAVAVLGVLALDGKFQSPPDDEQILLLISVGFVSGYLGFRIIRPVAKSIGDLVDSSVRRETGHIKRNVDRVEKEVAKVERETGAIHLEAAIAHGFTVAEKLAERRGPVDPFVIEAAIKFLSDARCSHPADRRAAILLARIYRHRRQNAMEDLESAIQVLTDAIQAKERLKETEGEDYADLLYNRACYYALLSNVTGRAELKSLFLADLASSIRMLGENAGFAKKDDDFEPFWSDPDFQRICQ